MRTIFIDSDFKCHTVNNGTYIPVETERFDGKCDAFIEGYRLIPAGNTWKRADGTVFQGEMAAPWKPYKELLAAQKQADELAVRNAAHSMTGTELIAQEQKIPPFDPGKDYSFWKAGSPVVDDGQVWALIVPHNAANYSGRPLMLRSLWGPVHTTDPQMAKPWVASYGNSGQYMRNECCTYPAPDGSVHIFRNLYDKNEFPPLTINLESRWEDMGVLQK